MNERPEDIELAVQRCYRAAATLTEGEYVMPWDVTADFGKVFAYMQRLENAVRPFADVSTALDHTLSRNTSVFLGDPNARIYSAGWATVEVPLGSFADAQSCFQKVSGS